MDTNEIYYRELLRIRRFEETVLENFQKGIFQGTTHTYLGQEANAVGILSHLRDGDIVFSSHRCHGHFLAYGGDMRALFAEMMGKETGVCAGRGGSQHLHWRNFFSNGVQGGIVPIATGMAYAEKLLKRETITICFLGDGTLGQGVIYESINFASLWKIPVLYVLENNQIAQTTPLENAVAGSIPARFEAFDIQVTEVKSFDVLEISKIAKKVIESVRKSRNPQAIILHTERFGPHSKGDDSRDSRIIEDLWRNHDPLVLQVQRLKPETAEKVNKQVEEEVMKAFEAALQDPISTQLGGEVLIDKNHKFPRQDFQKYKENLYENVTDRLTVLQSLNQSLHQALLEDERVFLMGEDILDPYGGAFKVTQGLSTAYPGRILGTPISEAGMIGIAAGLAIRGIRPIVEIMFGDFLTLGTDQIVNHIAKFHWMYNGQVNVPILIRTPMGGRRGYGPTHSQTLEKLFLGVPGLVVIAPSDLGDPGDLLYKSIKDENPVLFIENKLLYLRPVQSVESIQEFTVKVDFSSQGYPLYHLIMKSTPAPSLTLVTYGYMGMIAREAVVRLAYEYEIFADLIVLSQLAPYDLKAVIQAVQRTGRILVLEEGTRSLGWGAEVIAQVSETLGSALRYATRLAGKDLPIPAASGLEKAVLPGINDIVECVTRMDHGD